jgi:hypothetical protein
VKSLDAALDYAARGLRVFPVTWDGKKHPLLENWGEEASSDPGKIMS